MESRLRNRKNWFADLAAARRFAGKVGVPVLELDRRTHGAYVESLSRARCVGETALAFGAGAVVLSLVLFEQSVLPELPLGGVLGTELELLIGATIGALAIFFASMVIRANYGGWLVETRPTEMVDRAVESCADRDADTALVVVGAWHTDEVRDRAEERGVEVEVRSSPAAREYDGGSPLRHRILQSFGPA